MYTCGICGRQEEGLSRMELPYGWERFDSIAVLCIHCSRDFQSRARELVEMMKNEVIPTPLPGG